MSARSPIVELCLGVKYTVKPGWAPNRVFHMGCLTIVGFSYLKGHFGPNIKNIQNIIVYKKNCLKLCDKV